MEKTTDILLFLFPMEQIMLLVLRPFFFRIFILPYESISYTTSLHFAQAQSLKIAVKRCSKEITHNPRLPVNTSCSVPFLKGKTVVKLENRLR